MPRAARHHRNGPGALTLAFIDWRLLDGPRKLALACAVAIGICAIVEIPDFGWIEATELLLAICVIRLVARQVEAEPAPLPFHDGTLVCATAAWTAVVALLNLIDHANGGNQLIIAGACFVLFFAGLRMRSLGEDYWFE